ncbi:MAG TPA: lysoplasmalogenase family protein [Flavobacterium sp.]|nr:lysoplasmalogenase family protein [Flavobacterium sp.]
MVVHKGQGNVVNVLTASYFVIAISEIMAELFQYKPLIIIVKPLMPILLMVLYRYASDQRNILFFLAISFSVITNILFIPNDPQMLFFGIIAFMIHRIIILIYIFRLVKIRDYIPVAIATVPFLLVFFYLLASSEVPEESFVLLIIQNILISIFGGIALSNYIMNDNKKNSWLLICGLLFVALQFIVFIEKYYLSNLSPTVFRPIAMGLNAFAFYTFYEFVLAIEKSDDNGFAH